MLDKSNGGILILEGEEATFVRMLIQSIQGGAQREDNPVWQKFQTALADVHATVSSDWDANQASLEMGSDFGTPILTVTRFATSTRRAKRNVRSAEARAAYLAESKAAAIERSYKAADKARRLTPAEEQATLIALELAQGNLKEAATAAVVAHATEE